MLVLPLKVLYEVNLWKVCFTMRCATCRFRQPKNHKCSDLLFLALVTFSASSDERMTDDDRTELHRTGTCLLGTCYTVHPSLVVSRWWLGAPKNDVRFHKRDREARMQPYSTRVLECLRQNASPRASDLWPSPKSNTSGNSFSRVGNREKLF